MGSIIPYMKWKIKNVWNYQPEINKVNIKKVNTDVYELRPPPVINLFKKTIVVYSYNCQVYNFTLKNMELRAPT